MLRNNQDLEQIDLIEEQRIATSLSSGLTRVVGLCTLAALAAWVYGGVWAADFVQGRVLVHKFDMVFAYVMGMQDVQADANPTKTRSLNIDAVKDPGAEARRILHETRAEREEAQRRYAALVKERKEQFNKQFERLSVIQGATMAVWVVVMVLAGVLIFFAAASALVGSHRTRKWHRTMVYWMVFATICTVAGIWVLSRWGGFPAIPDPWILARVASVQSSYAILVAIFLIATHRSSPERGVSSGLKTS